MSLSAAAIRKLAEKGLSIEDIIELAEVIEDGFAQPVPVYDLSKDRKRARDAERMRRKREEEATSRDVAATVAKSVSPTPPSQKTPFTPLKGGVSPTENVTPLAKPTAEPEGFEEWYAAYPNKKAKGAARIAYRAALRKATATVLLEGVRAYPFTEDRKFIPHPATWLNGECWLDVEPARPPPSEVDPWPRRIMAFEVNGYWNSEWGPKPGRPGCLAPMQEIAA